VVALFGVRGHRLAVERPRLAPVDPLVGLARRRTEREDGPGAGRLAPSHGPHIDERSRRGVERLAVDLECRAPVEHDVQLFLARSDLIVLADQPALLGGAASIYPRGA